MSKFVRTAGLFCLAIFFSTFTFAYSDTPRLYIWGLESSGLIGRLDALVPILNGCDSLFYADIQAKAGGQHTCCDDTTPRLASGGLGYRSLNYDQIYGGYLFLDRNVSSENHAYWVLSPGFEMINCNWDARINGYIPVSKKTYNGPSFFPSGANACGLPGDCSFIEFTGHQQWEHQFHHFEEIGPGIDAEAGMTLPCFYNLSVHGGSYYYHLPEENCNCQNSILGIEGRAELPLQNNLALTVEASYDNQQRGTVVGGIRIQLGHVKPPQCLTLCDHFYDRVARNLGIVRNGSGIPVAHGLKDEGLFLRRDNIYFFTATGGTVFAGTGTGTFENPLNADQFNSSTVRSVKLLTGDGNFFFSPGVYSLGARTVTLLEGQSIFGRTENYACPAIGDERPLLSFTQDGAALEITGGNNNIDSIRLRNAISGTGANLAIGLDIESAPNVFICNSQIDVNAVGVGTAAAPFFLPNQAIGILANDSTVTIDPTVINATASIVGEAELGFFPARNIAIGIGTIDSFSNNSFTIIDSVITANAINSAISGNSFNFASGIGMVFSNSFANNNFRIVNTTITSNAQIETNNSLNQAVGIGDLFGFNTTNNNFELINSQVNSTALVLTDNTSGSENSAIGIGNRGGNYTNNNFAITNSSINTNASIAGDNITALNFALAVGDNDGISFSNNNFAINNSILNVNALVNGVNSGPSFAVGLGNIASGLMINNSFAVEQTVINVLATSGETTDVGVNEAFGVNDFGGNSANLYDINNCYFLVKANVLGVNAGINQAFGLFASNNTIINIANSVLNIFALVGTNTGINQAYATAGTGTINTVNTHFFVTS